MSALTLRSGDLRLEILPAPGGAVMGFFAGGFPIFRETQAAPASVSDCASFPLIPFSNRIRAGRFVFAGAAHQIPVDKRDPRFTNHGHTRHLPWEIVSATGTSLLLRFVQAAPAETWPFPFVAEQEFILSPTSLVMRARLRNAHTGPAPAGIGFHPYFTRLPGTALRFAAAHVWEADVLDIPIRSAVPTGRFDFSAGKPLEAPLINHAYGGWDGSAEITHPSGPRITLRAEGAFDHLVFFTPEGKSFFGFEPVSHRPDALNPLPDPNDRPMATLAPGETLEGGVEIGL